ncbi:MAG: murein biosynthesis integral membrane protein MurJ [bacterium]|jgi:putative peptidoglycan lipid II flippase
MAIETEEKIARSAGRVSAATMVSRILGLGRDAVFAALFGTSYVGDAYNVAFLIPNFLRRVFGEGALAAGFIPVYKQYLHREGSQRAHQLYIRFFSVLVVVLAVVVLGGVAFSEIIVKVWAFGWRDQPELFGLTVKLTRILFPFILFVGISGLSMVTLNCVNYFTVPALSPAMLNAVLMGVGVGLIRYFTGSPESAVLWFSVGTLAGVVFQIVVQLPLLFKTGHKPAFDLNLRDEGVRWVGRLLLPSIIALAATQVNVLVDTLLATTLPEGSVTALRLGNRLSLQPLGIFVAAIATVTLPALSDHAAKEDRGLFMHDLSFAFKLTMTFMIPSTVAVLVLGKPIVRLFFERGEFTAARSTPMTSITFICYSLGLVSYGGTKVITQAFYALKDTKTPVKIGVVVVIANVILNLVLVRLIGLAGLALATTFSATIGFVLLGVTLRGRIGDIGLRSLLSMSAKVLVAALVMGACMYLISNSLEPYTSTFPGKLLQVGAAAGAGLILLLGMSYILRAREVMFVVGMLIGKRGRE